MVLKTNLTQNRLSKIEKPAISKQNNWSFSWGLKSKEIIWFEIKDNDKTHFYQLRKRLLPCWASEQEHPW